jgi:hypothetical protein
MPEDGYLSYNETSKKRSTRQDILDYIADWIPGGKELKEMRKRIEGKSTKKHKKDNPWGEYE